MGIDACRTEAAASNNINRISHDTLFSTGLGSQNTLTSSQDISNAYEEPNADGDLLTVLVMSYLVFVQ